MATPVPGTLPLLDLIRGFIGSVVPLLSSLLQLMTTLKKRRQWANNAEASVGPFGALFFWADKGPTWLSLWLLSAIMLTCLVSLIAGIAMLANLGSDLPGWIILLFKNSLILTAIWFILAVVSHMSLIPHLMLFYLPSRHPELVNGRL